MAKRKPSDPHRLDTAYKGYLIRVHPITDYIWIEKDGQNIGSARSIEEAKRIIDHIIFAPYQEGRMSNAPKKTFHCVLRVGHGGPCMFSSKAKPILGECGKLGYQTGGRSYDVWNKKRGTKTNAPGNSSIKFVPITEPYMHGRKATVGNRSVEVVRAEAGRWHAFFYLDGKMIQTGESKATTQSEAIKQAKHFLKTGNIPVRNPNPSTRGAVKIYGRCLRIEAIKMHAHTYGGKPTAAGQKYFHDFTTKNAMIYGLPDGSLLIKAR